MNRASYLSHKASSLYKLILFIEICQGKNICTTSKKREKKKSFTKADKA